MRADMSIYAKFKNRSESIFRFDTRIYLSKNPDILTKGNPVAAIVAKNPGSAKAVRMNRWDKLELNGDKMLPSVRNRFLDAYKKVGKNPTDKDYIQVWNLFYLCNKDFVESRRIIEKFDSCFCESEIQSPKIVWFAWGGPDSNLDKFKQRFLSRNIKSINAFFYDPKAEKICSRAPLIDDFAKHPQGLKKAPIIEYLATLL